LVRLAGDARDLSPDDLINCSASGAQVVPQFFGEQDHPWLQVLLEEHERFIGKSQRELDARLREPLPCVSPPRKLRLAVQVLGGLRGNQPKTPVSPRRARAIVFAEAARTQAPSESVLSGVAASLGVSPRELVDSMFADLPGERLVGASAPTLSAAELALRCNLVLVQTLLMRASIVRIDVTGNTRAIVRQAKLRGLICTSARRPDTSDVTLEFSGPFALFRHTRLYGRALGDLVPLLAWCSRFRLRAECILSGRRLTLHLGTGDPIFPASAPRRYDSRLEERFAGEFRRVAPAWDVVREPEPIPAGSTLIFPDFALWRRSNPSRRWFLEIVGFWTPAYVTRKLALYRSARLTNLILCIDESRNCADAEVPAGAQVVRFRRRVDAAAVLRVLEAARPSDN